MIDKITLKNRESGNDAFPYTWDSIVGRTGGTTVKDALDALEAGGMSNYKIVTSIESFTDANTTYGIRDDINFGVDKTVQVGTGSQRTVVDGTTYYYNTTGIPLAENQTIKTDNGVIIWYETANVSAGVPETGYYANTAFTRTPGSSISTVYIGRATDSSSSSVNYKLFGVVNIPEGCVLKFDGGSLNNGVLVGNDTVIDAADTTIFNKIENAETIIDGTWTCEAKAEWYGGDIQECLDAFRYVKLLKKTYEITNTISLPYNSSVIGSEGTIVSATFKNGSTYGATFPIFEMGYYSEVKHLEVRVDKPCEVILVHSSHIADTYWGRTRKDEAKGRNRKNGRDVLGFANGTNYTAGSEKVYVSDIIIRCKTDYPTVATTGFNASLYAPDACCISAIADYDYTTRNNSLSGAISDFVCEHIRIAGPWLYAINLETRSAGSSAPWLTCCAFDDFRIDNCYNGIRLWANDPVGATKSTSGPGDIKFHNFFAQSQANLSTEVNNVRYGCTFADIQKAGIVYFDRCSPVDWSSAKGEYVIGYKIDRDNVNIVYINGVASDDLPVLTGSSTHIPYVLKNDTNYGISRLSNVSNLIDFYNYGTYRDTTSEGVTTTAIENLYKKVYGVLPESTSGLSEATLFAALPEALGINAQGFATFGTTTWYCYRADSTHPETLTWTTTNPNIKCKNKCFRGLPYGVFHIPYSTQVLSYLKLDSSLVKQMTSTYPNPYIAGKKEPGAAGCDYITFRFNYSKIAGAILELPSVNYNTRDTYSSWASDEAEIADWIYIYKDKKEFSTDSGVEDPLSAKTKMVNSGIFGTGQLNFLDRRLAYCKSNSVVYDVNGMNFNPIVGDTETRESLLTTQPTGSSLVKLSAIDKGKFYFDTDDNKPYWYSGSGWVTWGDSEGSGSGSTVLSGTYVNKPAAPNVGTFYYVTNIPDFYDLVNNGPVTRNGCMIYYDGKWWLNLSGTQHSFEFNLSNGIAIASLIPLHTAHLDTSGTDTWGSSSMYTNRKAVAAGDDGWGNTDVITYRYENSNFYRKKAKAKLVTDFIPVKPGMVITATNISQGSSSSEALTPFIVGFSELPSSEVETSSSSTDADLDITKAYVISGGSTGDLVSVSYTVPAGINYIKIQLYCIHEFSTITCSYPQSE